MTQMTDTERLLRERLAATEAQLEAARQALQDLPDTPEIRHWLGSQDVIGTAATTQIARWVHAAMKARAALAGVPAPQEDE